MRVGTEHFDQYLKLRKGREAYLLDKSKAGAIGGSVSRLSPYQAKKNTTAMGLSNIKKSTQMSVLCLQSFSVFKKGKRYSIIMEPGCRMTSPVEYQFKNWVEWLDYFKRYKIK